MKIFVFAFVMALMIAMIGADSSEEGGYLSGEIRHFHSLINLIMMPVLKFLSVLILTAISTVLSLPSISTRLSLPCPSTIPSFFIAIILNIKNPRT
ncbi:uncharacterized protein LOC144283743 isoform X3 [Canis aureus]